MNLRLLALAASAATVAVPAGAHADEATTVSLHVDSPYVVTVERSAPGSREWQAVCANPCDVPVPVLGQYRVRGRGVTPSAPFTLTPEGPTAILQVTPGSKNKTRTGWFVVAGGAAAVVAGAVIDAVGTGQGQVAGQGGPGDPGNTSTARVNFYLAGTTLLLAGLAAAWYGGALVVDNAHSRVRENDSPAADDGGEGSRDTLARVAETALAEAPSVVVPLFRASF